MQGRKLKITLFVLSIRTWGLSKFRIRDFRKYQRWLILQSSFLRLLSSWTLRDWLRAHPKGRVLEIDFLRIFVKSTRSFMWFVHLTTMILRTYRDTLIPFPMPVRLKPNSHLLISKRLNVPLSGRQKPPRRAIKKCFVSLRS